MGRPILHLQITIKLHISTQLVQHTYLVFFKKHHTYAYAHLAETGPSKPQISLVGQITLAKMTDAQIMTELPGGYLTIGNWVYLQHRHN
jgi:hypothetical protein